MGSDTARKGVSDERPAADSKSSNSLATPQQAQSRPHRVQVRVVRDFGAEGAWGRHLEIMREHLDVREVLSTIARPQPHGRLHPRSKQGPRKDPGLTGEQAAVDCSP